MNEFRSKGNYSLTEAAKAGGAEWRTMSPADKQVSYIPFASCPAHSVAAIL